MTHYSQSTDLMGFRGDKHLTCPGCAEKVIQLEKISNETEPESESDSEEEEETPIVYKNSFWYRYFGI